MEHRNSPRWVKVRQLRARREELRADVIACAQQVREHGVASTALNEPCDALKAIERQLKELEVDHAKE